MLVFGAPLRPRCRLLMKTAAFHGGKRPENKLNVCLLAQSRATALRPLQRLGSQRNGAKHALVAVAGGRNNVGVDIVQLRRGDVAVVEL